jgi:hypothetical protein
MQAAFDDPVLGDTALVLRGGKVLFVSRSILCLWSPVLKRLIFNGWSRESLSLSQSSGSAAFAFASPSPPRPTSLSAFPSSGAVKEGGEEAETTAEEKGETDDAIERDDGGSGSDGDGDGDGDDASSRSPRSGLKKRRQPPRSASAHESAAKRPRKQKEEAAESVVAAPEAAAVSGQHQQQQQQPQQQSQQHALPLSPPPGVSPPGTFGMPYLLLPEEDPDEFEIFLRKLYPPCDLPITKDNVVVLMTLADRYGVERILEECQAVVQNWPPSLETLSFASRFAMREVADRCLTELVAGNFLTLPLDESTEDLLAKSMTKAGLAQAVVIGMRAVRQFATFRPPSIYERMTLFDGLSLEEQSQILASGSSAFSAVRDAVLSHLGVCQCCAEIRRMALRKNRTVRPAPWVDWVGLRLDQQGRKSYFWVVTKLEDIVFVPGLPHEWFPRCSCRGGDEIRTGEPEPPKLPAQPKWVASRASHPHVINIRMYDPSAEKPVDICSVRCDVHTLKLADLKYAILMKLLRPEEPAGAEMSRSPAFSFEGSRATVTALAIQRAAVDNWYTFEEETPAVWNFCDDDDAILHELGIRTGDILHFEHITPTHHPAGTNGRPLPLAERYFQSLPVDPSEKFSSPPHAFSPGFAPDAFGPKLEVLRNAT